MEKVYFSHGGKVIVHDVVHETKDSFYINRADDNTRAIMPIPKEMMEIKVHETFKGAKEGRLKEISDIQKRLDEEVKDLENQKKAVDGNEVPDRPEEKEDKKAE